MANIKHWTNCGACYCNIARAHTKVIGASLYCPTCYSDLIRAEFDKTRGNPLEALARLSVSGR